MARLPGSRLPTRLKMPMAIAGLTAAARTASARGMPKDTAVFMHFIRSVTEPAKVPSLRVARLPLT